MNQSMNLSQHQALQQTLSPQMIQSLRLLQISTLQLEQMIRQELEINPVLEEAQEEELEQEQEEPTDEADAEENSDVDSDLPDDGDLKVEDEEIDWEEYLEDGFDLGYRQSDDLSAQGEEKYHSEAVAERSLEDHLLLQVNERSMSEDLRTIVLHLIGCLDVAGYLTYPLQDIANDLKTSIFQVEEALNIIQKLEPTGIGARNLQECLILQLKAKKRFDSLELKIVTEHFGLLQKLKIMDIANAVGQSVQEVQESVRVIGTLNPRPGESVGMSGSQTIVPDLIVEKVSGEFVVYLNDGSVPHLQINRTYANLLRRNQKTPRDIRNFVKDKMNAANWLIKAIEQRKATMLRVMRAILEFQADFFEKGPAFLRPLVMQAVADKIGMHISTISRVANGKYVQTSHGIFELKYFFSAGVEQQSGEDVSAAKAMVAIKELVEGEDTKSPLSDQKIVALLKEQHIDIARRTVAKYRDRLKILPARLRKRY